MKLPRLRMTIGRLMVVVAVVALVSAVGLAVPPTLEAALKDWRSGSSPARSLASSSR